MPTKVVKPGDLATPWNSYAAMNCDVKHEMGTAGDGLLTRDELGEHIKKLERQRLGASAWEATAIEMDLNDARRALNDMNVGHIDAVEYLPEYCRELPEHLKRRATEILMFDDKDAYGDITQDLISAARSRYRRLGGGPARAMNTSRDTAIAELDELEDWLFPGAE
jgi:hypothetical protein